MKVYAILLSDKNPDEKLMNDDVVKVLKKHNAIVILLDLPMLRKYVGCFGFRTKKQRDECSWALDRMGIIYDTRDDGIIDDRYAEGWDDQSE